MLVENEFGRGERCHAVLIERYALVDDKRSLCILGVNRRGILYIRHSLAHLKWAS